MKTEFELFQRFVYPLLCCNVWSQKVSKAHGDSTKWQGKRAHALSHKLCLPDSLMWSRVCSQFYVKDVASAVANTLYTLKGTSRDFHS